MITTSSDYKTAVNADVRKWVPKVLAYFDGVTPTDISVDLASFSLLDEKGADSDTPLGAVSANEFSLSLDNSERKYTPTNHDGPYYGQLKPEVKLIPYLGLTLTNSTIEYIPLGVFWTQDWSAPSGDIEATVTCYDLLYTLGNQDVPMVPINPDTTIRDLFTALFTGLGLTSDEYEVDATLTQPLKVGWLPTGKVKDALQKLCEAGNCFVRAERYGKIIVKSNVQTNTPVTTWTDQNQIANVDNPQKYFDIYDKVKVNWKIPELKEKGTVLSLTNVDIPANENIQINTAFNNPVGSISYVRLQGFEPELDASYGASSIVFTVYNSGGEAIKVSIGVVGQELDFVSSLIAVGTGTKELMIDNELIQNYAYANTLANKLYNWLNDPYISYELGSRGDPALEPGDVIEVQAPSNKIDSAIISPYRIALDYDGGLTCKISARKPML